MSTSLVVVGGGMSGLCAAIAARQAGASVTVVEASRSVGGSAVLSAGRIWTFDDLPSHVPLGDAGLQRLLVSEFAETVSWLRDLGLPLDIQPTSWVGHGVVMTLGTTGARQPFLDQLADAARQIGVDIRLATRVLSGRDLGDRFSIACEGPNATEVIESGSLVLATGGFQGDPDLLADVLGPESRHLMIRSAPESNGTGLRIGKSLGGGVSRGMADFYGHTMPLFSNLLMPAEFKSATLSIAARSILVNSSGMRFTDESAGTVEESNAISGMYQSGGVYYLICDSTLSAEIPFGMLERLADRAAVPQEKIIIRADDLHELTERMNANWGVDAVATRESLASVVAAANLRTGSTLRPPRSQPPPALDSAPFFAMACVAGMTIPYGGLSVDGDLRVLDPRGQRVPAVWAVGADAGGVFKGAYGGGLAWAAVSGRHAGQVVPLEGFEPIPRERDQ